MDSKEIMKETLIKGIPGSVIPICLAISPLQVEVYLRIASLALGCIVGILTSISLIKKLYKE